MPDSKMVLLFRATAEAILFSKYKDEPAELDGDPVLFAIYNSFLQRVLDDAERYNEICEKRAEARRGKTKEKEETKEN